MCLMYSYQASEEIRRRLSNKGYIDCYKLYNYKNQLDNKVCLQAQIRGDLVKTNAHKFIVSNRKSTGLYPQERACGINKGIHVYVNKPESTRGGILVKVRCYKADFVGAQGHVLHNIYYKQTIVTQAVFTKVKLLTSKQDILKRIKQLAKQDNKIVKSNIRCSQRVIDKLLKKLDNYKAKIICPSKLQLSV
jgi:hypothetical protein